MKGAVGAELRRLQRAIGMSTWDIMTAHNRRIKKFFPGGARVFLCTWKTEGRVATQS